MIGGICVLAFLICIVMIVYILSHYDTEQKRIELEYERIEANAQRQHEIDCAALGIDKGLNNIQSQDDLESCENNSDV